jgi:hypothetical protein
MLFFLVWLVTGRCYIGANFKNRLFRGVLQHAFPDQEFNPEFARYWLEKTGEEIKISRSHGGSGSQARPVIDRTECLGRGRDQVLR